MIGSTIGKYRVVDRLGRGGMGTVYRAMDEMLHREVAIKVLNAELNDPEIARRFRAEAITVARLSHPGIATIYELFEHEGQWLMVMEFVRGETLEGMVTRMGPLSPQRAAELCMQALAALAHAHSMGVVHRDLKPANLMITENGVVKVMDFGIARVSGSEHLTNAGFMMGTPAYMAPEQVKGGEIDARADLYAMGVVFYRLTTATLPFKGETPFAMAQSQVSDPPTPISLVRGDLPTWAEDITARALAKDPEHRFQSAAEFHEAFARSLAGLTLSSLRTPGAGLPTLTPTRPLPIPGLTPTPTGTMAGPLTSGSVPTMAAPGPTGSLPTMAASGTPSGMAAAPSDTTVMAGSSGSSGSPGSSGASGSAGASGSSGSSGVVAGGQPAGPVAAPAPVARRSPLIWLGLAAVAVVAVVAAFVFRGRSTPPAAPVTPPAAATQPVAPAPSATDAAVPPSPTSTPAAATGALPSAARSTGAVPPAPGVTAGKTLTSPSPQASPAAAAAGVGAAGAAPALSNDPLMTFPDAKLYDVTGKRATDRDAVLNFVGGQLLIMPKSGGAAMATLPYSRIRHATYVRGREPRWDKAYASPPEDLDIGSVMGSLIRTSRHWLVIQTADHYEILRLDDANFAQVLGTLESRAGIKIDKPK